MTTRLTHLRSQLPFLNGANGVECIFMDSGATSLRPQSVLDSMQHYYKTLSSNVHRGLYPQSEEATRLFELARDSVQEFIGADKRESIIFTKGTTEAINLVARTWGETNIGPGDEILLTTMEHHSNIVPWQLLAERVGAVIKVVGLNDKGELDLDSARSLMSDKTRIFAFLHVSNTLGSINPASELVAMAKQKGITTLIDGAQAVAHFPVDVTELDCDFYCFSGHKLFGPTGVGVLYGKEELLEKMPPFLGGGDMIDQVSFEQTSFNRLPYKFEAGTPPIAEVIGLGEAINFVQTELDWQEVLEHEHSLREYAQRRLEEVPGIFILGNAKKRLPIFSFAFEQIHAQDLASFLNKERLALRSGHHCTQPLMQYYRVPSTTRASLSWYNLHSEIDTLVETLHHAVEFFREIEQV